MPAIFDRIREGADRAVFEADRLRRLQQAQSQLKALKRDVQQATDQLGAATLRLYDEGRLSQPELVQLCQEIDALRGRVTAQEQEIERIRQERPPAPRVAASRFVPVLYGHICPNCRIELPAEARFCPHCGGPAADVAPPAPEPAACCVTCGAYLSPEARFCPACGAPRAALPEPVVSTCATCGTPLKSGIVFCPQCGTRVKKEVQASPEPEAGLASGDEGSVVGETETSHEMEEYDEMP